eukprot:34013-Amphidinium_carterae.1
MVIQCHIKALDCETKQRDCHIFGAHSSDAPQYLTGAITATTFATARITAGITARLSSSQVKPPCSITTNDCTAPKRYVGTVHSPEDLGNKRNYLACAMIFL